MKKQLTIQCWDNGGKTVDRYTIVISGRMIINDESCSYLISASSNPYHPQGIGQHSVEMPTSVFNEHSWKHLGKQIAFTDLPDDVQRFIATELMP